MPTTPFTPGTGLTEKDRKRPGSRPLGSLVQETFLPQGTNAMPSSTPRPGPWKENAPKPQPPKLQPQQQAPNAPAAPQPAPAGPAPLDVNGMGLEDAFKATSRAFAETDAAKDIQRRAREQVARLKPNAPDFNSQYDSIVMAARKEYLDAVYDRMRSSAQGRYKGTAGEYNPEGWQKSEREALDPYASRLGALPEWLVDSRQMRFYNGYWDRSGTEPRSVDELLEGAALAGVQDSGLSGKITYDRATIAPESVEDFYNWISKGNFTVPPQHLAQITRQARSLQFTPEQVQERKRWLFGDSAPRLGPRAYAQAEAARNSLAVQSLQADAVNAAIAQYKADIMQNADALDVRSMAAIHRETGLFLPVAYGDPNGFQQALATANDYRGQLDAIKQVRDFARQVGDHGLVRPYSQTGNVPLAFETTNALARELGASTDDIERRLNWNSGLQPSKTAASSYILGNLSRTERALREQGSDKEADLLARVRAGVSRRDIPEEELVARYKSLLASPDGVRGMLETDPEMLGAILAQAPYLKGNEDLDVLGPGSVFLTQAVAPIVASIDPTGVSDAWAYRRQNELLNALGESQATDSIRTVNTIGNTALPFLTGVLMPKVPGLKLPGAHPVLDKGLKYGPLGVNYLTSWTAAASTPEDIKGNDQKREALRPAGVEAQRQAYTALSMLGEDNSPAAQKVRWQHLGETDEQRTLAAAGMALLDPTAENVAAVLERLPEGARADVAANIWREVTKGMARSTVLGSISNGDAGYGLRTLLMGQDSADRNVREAAMGNLGLSPETAATLGYLSNYVRPENVPGTPYAPTTTERRNASPMFQASADKVDADNPSNRQVQYDKRQDREKISEVPIITPMVNKRVEEDVLAPLDGVYGKLMSGKELTKTDLQVLIDLDEKYGSGSGEESKWAEHMSPEVRDRVDQVTSALRRKLPGKIIMNPGLWAQGGELLFRQLGANSVGKFIGANPWVVWVALAALAAGGVGLAMSIFGGSRDDEELKGIRYDRL